MIKNSQERGLTSAGKRMSEQGNSYTPDCQVCGPELQHLNDTEELNVSLMDAGLSISIMPFSP